jgi:hypothetical protein
VTGQESQRLLALLIKRRRKFAAGGECYRLLSQVIDLEHDAAADDLREMAAFDAFLAKDRRRQAAIKAGRSGRKAQGRRE